MSRITQIILILLALALIYGFIVRMKKKNGKSQEQLLDEMSRAELLDLAIAVKPEGVDASGLQQVSNDMLKEFIRRNQK